ncbi:hypothetical protein IDG69_15035, partial [Staphylococcus sp. EG-SA-23]|nr:hypothetical protein [Staphylococcus sp. EG-SA-23]
LKQQALVDINEANDERALQEVKVKYLGKKGSVSGLMKLMKDLKGTLELLAKKLFGADREIRLRPSYFPFTEPSVEVDVSCFK